MKNLSEKELVILAQAGNPKAVSILIEKSRKNMIISLKRSFRGIPLEEIEDVVQISLVKVFKNLNKYESTYSFNTWVTTISKRSMIDKIRRDKNKPQEVSINQSNHDTSIDDNETTLLNLIPSIDLNPEEIMVNQDRADFAIKLINLDGVSFSVQQVVVMRYMKGMSYDEIVKETNQPIGTIKAWLYRFRKNVRNSVSKSMKESVL